MGHRSLVIIPWIIYYMRLYNGHNDLVTVPYATYHKRYPNEMVTMILYGQRVTKCHKGHVAMTRLAYQGLAAPLCYMVVWGCTQAGHISCFIAHKSH